MSQYGSDPNHPDQGGQPADGQPGADNPYGAPAQNPYGQPPTGQQPYGAAPTYPNGQAAGAPSGGYASWVKRVGAYIIDALCAILAGPPLWIGYVVVLSHIKTTTDASGVRTSTMTSGARIGFLLILVGAITYLAFWIWNTCIRQGKTGYSIGKGTMGIRLLDEPTGQPIGGFMSFLRQIVHIVDGICYIGYLWPLWDAKKQTFADKILHTVVVNQSERG